MGFYMVQLTKILFPTVACIVSLLMSELCGKAI